MAIRIALYQPDIPQNTGTILRMGACLNVPVDIIEPAGFPTTDRAFRRAGMDYLDSVNLIRHQSFGAFQIWRRKQANVETREKTRLVLLSTQAKTPYTTFRFSPNDILLLGRESAGVPQTIHGCVDARIMIPLWSGMRSLNIAMAAAMVLGEALRQTQSFPESNYDLGADS